VFAGWCLVFAVLAGTPAGSARAGILFDNLGAATASSDSVATPIGPLANSFSTGVDPVLLTDVKVLLASDAPAVGSVEVDLVTDAGTSPGAFLLALGTISDSSLTSTPTVFDLPVSVPFALAANTRYWIEISTTNGSVAEWAFSNDISGPGVANEFFYFAGSVASNLNGPHQMQVQADPIVTTSAVPEPSSLILMVLGFSALAFSHRRRQLRTEARSS
jgi:hypothetical protein